MLLRRRSVGRTCALLGLTLAFYGAILCTFPAFVEQKYGAKQRLWAQFLGTCQCDSTNCTEAFDLTMMHGSLYNRLLAAALQPQQQAAPGSSSSSSSSSSDSAAGAGGGAGAGSGRFGGLVPGASPARPPQLRPVIQHLVWQPHKLVSAYPWRTRMYAHMSLMLPRSLALLHAWWLSSTEDLALALAHLSQGVPLVLDPDSSAGLRVEPDAVLRCSLADPEPEPDQEQAGAGAGGLRSEQPGGGGAGGGRRRRGAPGGSGAAQEDGEEGTGDAEEEDEDGEEDGEQDEDGEMGGAEEGAPGAAGADADGAVEGAQELAPQQGLDAAASRASAAEEDVTASAAQAALDAAAGGAAAAADGSGSNSSAEGAAVVADGGQDVAAKPAAAGDAPAGNAAPAPAPAAGGVATPVRPASKRARAASGGAKKRRRGAAADAEPMRPFRCVVLEARGRMPLLNLNTPPVKPAAAAAAAAPPDSQSSQPPQSQQPSPEQSATPGAGEAGAGYCGADANMDAAGTTSGESAGSCRAPAPPASEATAASCPAGGEGEGGSCAAGADGGQLAGNSTGGPDATNSTGADLNDTDAPDTAANRSAAAGAGRGRAGAGAGAGRAGRRPRRRGAAAGSGGAAAGGRDAAGGGSVCRNVIYVRPPQRAELADHVREVEASPLGLPPVELLRRVLPKVAELAGWLVLPHAMWARYVLLLSKPPPALLLGAPGVGPAPQAPAPAPGPAGGAGVFGFGAWDGAEAGAGHVGTAVRLLLAWLGRLPLLHVGTQLMLLAGGLMTFCDLQLWGRVAAELASLRRPRRPWPRRRLAAWRVLYEGLVQPQREALLSWNITHFVVLPMLRMALPAPALDVALLLPLVYSVGVLGAGNSDVAARASAALLRVARRARHHEGGYHLMLLSVVEGADPTAIPAACRLLLTAIMDNALGPPARAAVAAAMLEEAPGLAAALAAEAQRREHAAAAAAAAGGAGAAGAGAETGAEGGAGAGVFGPGGELAAAMQAQVAPAVDRHQRRGGAGGGPAAVAAGEGGAAAGAEEELEYDSDEEDEDAAQGHGRAGGPVVLRWPAPLQLPAEAGDWEDVPRGFTCAITQGLMLQPAMLVSPDLPSAPTYERAAIQQWLASQMRDPKSNTPLRSYSLLPNEDLSRAIDDWVHWRLRAESEAARRKQAQGERGQRRAHEDADAAGPSSGAAAADLYPGSDSGASSGDEAGGGGAAGGAGASTSTGGGSRPPRARRARSGAAAPTRSTSVLASLARGASSLLEGGAEVVSRGAAVAAATAAAAAAATAEAVARQGVRRRNARRGVRERAVADMDGAGEEGAE